MPKNKKQLRYGHPVRIPADIHRAVVSWAKDDSRGFTHSITSAYRILLSGALSHRRIPIHGVIDADAGKGTSRRDNLQEVNSNA